MNVVNYLDNTNWHVIIHNNTIRMTTPTHTISNLLVLVAIQQITTFDVNYIDLVLVLSSNLIDLDHLFSKPIYHPRRNPFLTHFVHKRWALVIMISIILIFIRPTMFLGVGIIMHMLLDYIYIKREGF